MELFKQLFDSNWRERGDQSAFARVNQHYDSMAGQVMANRNEVAYLYGELNRVSQDLAQSMLLNRALVKVLVAQGVVSPEKLQEVFNEVLKEHEPFVDDAHLPSKFCEDCGRPLPTPGQKCPFCGGIELQVPEPKAPEPPKTAKPKKNTKKKSKSKRKSEPEKAEADKPESAEPEGSDSES